MAHKAPRRLTGVTPLKRCCLYDQAPGPSCSSDKQNLCLHPYMEYAVFRFARFEDALALREVKSLRAIPKHTNVVRLRQLIHENEYVQFVFEFCTSNLFKVRPFASQGGVHHWVLRLFLRLLPAWPRCDAHLALSYTTRTCAFAAGNRRHSEI